MGFLNFEEFLKALQYVVVVEYVVKLLDIALAHVYVLAVMFAAISIGQPYGVKIVRRFPSSLPVLACRAHKEHVAVETTVKIIEQIVVGQ